MKGKYSNLIILAILVTCILAASPSFGRWQKDGRANAGYRSLLFDFSRAANLPHDLSGESAYKIPLRTRDVRTSTMLIGETHFDEQQISSSGRQIEHRNSEYIHFAWADSTDTIRGIRYQAFEIEECAPLFPIGGIHIHGNWKAGYVSVDVDPGGWAVVAGNEMDSIIYPKAYWDFMTGGQVFGVFTSDYPFDYEGWYYRDSANYENSNLWPKIEWDIDGTEQVLHMVATERNSSYLDDTWIRSGFPATISYYRRVGGYGTGSGVWSSQRVIDTVVYSYNNVTIAASPTDDDVAIVWSAPLGETRDPDVPDCLYSRNNVWYALSTDQGSEWANDSIFTANGAPSIAYMVEDGQYPGGNITQYVFEYAGKWWAYCDLSALFTSDDNLHVIWTSHRRLGESPTTCIDYYKSAIFHWSEDNPIISTVFNADWEMPNRKCGIPERTGSVAKINISECDGKLYVLFNQYGNKANPCADVSKYYSYKGRVINGELYLAVSSDSGQMWDRPQNLTNTFTPDCYEGECHSEASPSMARYGRIDSSGCQGIEPGTPVLDILYVDDGWPGTLFEEDVTMNEVLWMVTPCRDIVLEPGYSDDAGSGYGECYSENPLVVKPGNDTTVILKIVNPGLLDNNYTFSINYIDGDDWVNPEADSGIIGCCLADTVELSMTFTAPDGSPDPSTWRCEIVIMHEAEDSPRIIPACLVVASDFAYPESAVIATECKRLRIYNNGRLSNSGSNSSLDFVDPPDPEYCADIYLYDGSPIICRMVNSTPKCFFAYDNIFTSDNGLRPLDSIIIDSTSNPDYHKTSIEFLAADSAIGLIAEYYTPEALGNCGFVIAKLFFWNRTDSSLDSVAVGEILDWDIPSHESGSKNESGFDESRRLLFQYCCDSDPCDSTAACQRYGGIAAPRYSEVLLDEFKNSMTLENDVFIYASGPFGGDAPLPADTIFELMTATDGYHTTAVDSCEDLFSLVTFDVYDLQPYDTQCVTMILATSRDDADGILLMENVDGANAFLDFHPEIRCSLPCDCIPGDANGDGSVNVGDAVYIINYVFKGGPAPTPYPICSGDANGDCLCNVGDAVYIISYIFKGGPPPVTCEEWIENCDWPLRK